MKRIGYFDVLRLFSVILIFIVHFINDFRPDYFVLWNEGVSSIFLNGVSGKAAVAMLAVILGYFA